MSNDPYEILGITKTASQDDIRKAYRKLAKQYHPDLNPDNKIAEEKFKAIGAANAILSDPAQRARYDSGEIDGSGQERAPPGYRGYAEGAQGRRYAGGAQFSEDDLGGIFGDMFGQGFGRRQQQGPRRGADQQFSLTVDLLDTINGNSSRITLPGGGTLDVKIPPGAEDGTVLRLRGKGGAGHMGGPAGDALITLTVAPSPIYTREGMDVRMTLPVPLRTAVLGGTITIPTPAGSVNMNVPAHSDTGTVLRLKGRGVKAHSGREAGNLYVKLAVEIGQVDEALESFLKNWTPAHTEAETAT